MIVLCPKAFAGSSLDKKDEEFLRNFLIEINEEAVVANEVWNAWKFILLKENPKEKAENRIARQRGTIRPEILILDEESFREVDPLKQYTEAEMITATAHLVERKWADIDFFIVENPSKYQESKKVIPLTHDQFQSAIMASDRELYAKIMGAISRAYDS